MIFEVTGIIADMPDQSHFHADFLASMKTHGEIKNPLNPIQIAGNLYKSFLSIQDIGSDSKLLPAVKTPTIAFDGFTVNG